MSRYTVNEFILESNIDFPFADRTARVTVPHGIRLTLKRGSLSGIPSLLRKLRRQLAYDVGTGFLIEPRIGAAFHIDYRGETVTFDADGEHFNTAFAWLIHAGLGSATLLHGGLPLHGAALELDNRRFCLMGHSEAGKSTLAWYLLQQGALFANDDLTPVRMLDGTAVSYPAVSLYPQIDETVVAHFDVPREFLIPIHYGKEEMEYLAPLPIERRVVHASPLSSIFFLNPVKDCGDCKGACTCRRISEVTPDNVVSRRLPIQEAAVALFSTLHAEWIIGKWLTTEPIKHLCAVVAEQVPLYELTYRQSYSILPEIDRTIREILYPYEV